MDFRYAFFDHRYPQGQGGGPVSIWCDHHFFVQCSTSPLHQDDQVVDCGLDIGNKSIQSVQNMLNGRHLCDGDGDGDG